MRSFFTTLVATAGLTVAFAAKFERVREIEVLEYDIHTQRTKFTFPCSGCFGAEAAQADLVFDLLPVSSATRDGCDDFQLSGERVDLCHTQKEIAPGHLGSVAEFSALFSVNDTAGYEHVVNVTGTGVRFADFLSGEPKRATVQFSVHSVDERTVSPLNNTFIGSWAGQPIQRLEYLVPLTQPHIINITEFSESFMVAKPIADMKKSSLLDDVFDIDDEMETLRLLEADVVELQAEIAARKQAVNRRIRQHTAKLPLKHLIEQCDGLLCAARMVTERICDKMGLSEQSLHDYVQVDTNRQDLVAFSDESEKPPQNSRNSTKINVTNYGTTSTHQQSDKSLGASLPMMMAQGSSQMTTLNFFENVRTKPQTILVRALAIIAGALGIAALIACIRRKCMSMRSRVERAADKEERQNARAYRRAARRALMRRRWDNFVSAVSCFHGTPEEPRVEDYEEKRALILQDAFLEQDLDQAEKGQVMEAEIRELRHAHEIVASLIRVGENRYDLRRPMNDPPPSLVPLPYSRSRASTTTLPSYTSESLPDYTSTPETSLESSTVTDGFVNYTPTHSDEEGRYTPAPSCSAGTRSSLTTRYTPVSSVVAITPRCSEETLRTRRSKDSRDSDLSS